MSKWYWIRISLLAALLVTVGGYLGYLGLKKLGPVGPDYVADARAGMPVVEAVYRYKAEQGVWPLYLDELVGAYLPEAGVLAEWDYAPGLYMQRGNGAYGSGLRYDFVPAVEGWKVVSSDGQVRPLGVAQGRGAPKALPREQVIANMLAVLERRTREEKWDLGHYRQLASAYVALGRRDDAERTVMRAYAQLNEASWPRLALATLDILPPATGVAGTMAATGSAPDLVTVPAATQGDAAGALAAYARRQDSFLAWYTLAAYYRAAGEMGQAEAAIKEAAKHKVELPAHDLHHFVQPQAFAYDAGRLAYNAGAFEAALAIADAWIDYAENPERLEGSAHALRAAALLALGRTGEAQEAMKAADAAAAKGALYAKNLDALRGAVGRGDRAFRWDMGTSPAAYEAFVAGVLP